MVHHRLAHRVRLDHGRVARGDGADPAILPNDDAKAPAPILACQITESSLIFSFNSAESSLRRNSLIHFGGIEMTIRLTKLHKRGTVAALAMGTLLITGCAAEPAGNSAPAAAEPAPVTESAAAPTPTPTPEALDLDDPSSWLIDFTAVGPLALGDRLSDELPSMTAFTTAVQEGCPWETAFDKADYPSIWIPDPAATGVVEQIVVQKWGSADSVAPNSPQTSAGIGIGATQEELTAAYPSITTVEGLYAPYYALPDDSGHWINFAVTEEGLVDTIVVRASSRIDSEYCG